MFDLNHSVLTHSFDAKAAAAAAVPSSSLGFTHQSGGTKLVCLALFAAAIQPSCDFSAIVSRLFSPSLSPRLVKSRCASAAPAASDALLRSGEALSPKSQNTHTRTHTLSEQRRSASSDRRGPFKNDNNDCNSVFKGSLSINSLTPPSWICTAAPTAAVKAAISRSTSGHIIQPPFLVCLRSRLSTRRTLFYSKCYLFSRCL